MQSTEINELAMALVSAQSEFSAVPKGSVNPFFKSKYAGLPEVVQHTAPVLAKHGLAISQFITYSEHGGDELLTYLMHNSGQFIAYSMRLHLAKEDMQSFGSACTYARRYAYMSCLSIISDEDDDGNSATKAKASAKPKEKTSAETMRDLLSAKFSEPIERKKFVEGLMGRELKSLNDLSEAEIVGVILELS